MLPNAPSAAPSEQLVRQACIEQGRRLRAGEGGSAEALLAVYPTFAADAEAALELIYTEFVLREELGQCLDPAAWCARFPQWQGQLDKLFQVHVALRASDPSATEAAVTVRISAGGCTLVDLAARRCGC